MRRRPPGAARAAPASADTGSSRRAAPRPPCASTSSGAAIVGKALPEIDRLVLAREPRHGLEDAGAERAEGSIGLSHGAGAWVLVEVGRVEAMDLADQRVEQLVRHRAVAAEILGIGCRLPADRADPPERPRPASRRGRSGSRRRAAAATCDRTPRPPSARPSATRGCAGSAPCCCPGSSTSRGFSPSRRLRPSKS